MRGVVGLVPLNSSSIFLLRVDSIFISVMILLCRIETHSVSADGDVSPLGGSCLHHTRVVNVAILVVLN